jgi:hypothetical protein
MGGAPLPLLGSLAMGAQQAKLDYDPRTSSSLGMPSIHYVHDYCFFALAYDGGRLARMAVGLGVRLVILVAIRRFLRRCGVLSQTVARLCTGILPLAGIEPGTRRTRPHA